MMIGRLLAIALGVALYASTAAAQVTLPAGTCRDAVVQHDEMLLVARCHANPGICESYVKDGRASLAVIRIVVGLSEKCGWNPADIEYDNPEGGIVAVVRGKALVLFALLSNESASMAALADPAQTYGDRQALRGKRFRFVRLRTFTKDNGFPIEIPVIAPAD